MKVTWSPLAIQRVLDAADFIAVDKPDAATRWADSIFAAVERLEQFPQSGRIVPELERQDLREIIHGSYRIVYRIRGEEVVILTVRASRRLFDASEIG